MSSPNLCRCIATFAPGQTVQVKDTTYHYALRLERVETPRRFYITTQRGRSKLYTLTPDTSPLIERATVTYDYPDYTNWPDAHYRLTSTGIRALTDSSITLHIESNTTLAGGSLELTTSTPSNNQTPTDQTYQLTPNPTDARIAAVTFPCNIQANSNSPSPAQTTSPASTHCKANSPRFPIVRRRSISSSPTVRPSSPKVGRSIQHS